MSKTPPPDYGTMLVFAPPSLPYIFHSLITDYAPALRNAEPANALYMLARFACLACDDTWLEDLIIGATDAIEDAFFVGGTVSYLNHLLISLSEPFRGLGVPRLLAV